jgi:hypothetical protein
MADAVTAKTIFKGTHRAVYQFTNVSDGSGETNVKKIDISTLSVDPRFSTAPTTINITRVFFNTYNMGVKISYNHTTPDVVLALDGSSNFDMTSFGGITDPGSTGGDGSLLFSTIGAVNGAVYSIIMEVAW